jgi:predicted RecA/RadA family phage recombinase
MLAIALEDIYEGQTGTFLLKGFVTTPYVDLGGARDGEPLYIQRGSGEMTNASAWTGTGGTDIWRCIGYLVSNPATNGTNVTVIRFDPSTDYII